MEQLADDQPVSLATGSDGLVQSSQCGPQGPAASTAATGDAAADCSNMKLEGRRNPVLVLVLVRLAVRTFMDPKTEWIQNLVAGPVIWTQSEPEPASCSRVKLLGSDSELNLDPAHQNRARCSFN